MWIYTIHTRNKEEEEEERNTKMCLSIVIYLILQDIVYNCLNHTHVINTPITELLPKCRWVHIYSTILYQYYVNNT